MSPRSWRAGLGHTCLVLSLCALVAGCGGKPDPGVEIRTTRADTTAPGTGREKALYAAAAALFVEGQRSGDPELLRQSVRLWREHIALQNRATDPHRWASTQLVLGVVLKSLGEREEGTARLEEAVAAYRAALEVVTRDSDPQKWAGFQNVLGLALQTLGEREKGTARLEEAVAAFRAALEVQQAASPAEAERVRKNLARAEALLAARR